MGISLTAIPGGRIEARPKRALTDEARRLIRSHKPAILAALTISPAAFYERVLGNTPKSIATLEPEQRAEAVRIGLLPREIAGSDAVVLAYRSNGAQGLMTIPAEKYDGLRVLELFDAT
jgi:hypothetical protein